MDVPEWWTTLLILPWDHSFAHTVGIYLIMASGASLAAVQSGKSYFDSLKNIPGNIREIKPVITGKMVRAKITEFYKGKIDYLYTPEAKSMVNPQNIEALKKLFNIN